MTTSVDRIFKEAQQLSPTEQLELIQVISQSLLRQYKPGSVDVIPASIRRTPPITDIAQFAADFWPDDETADDVNDYIAQQRREDRMRDL